MVALFPWESAARATRFHAAGNSVTPSDALPFGSFARAWGRVLTQAQRDRWNAAGPNARSAARLGSGPLTGQLHFQGINSAWACIGLPPLWEPPVPVQFDPNPVGQLLIPHDESGLRLRLPVTAPVTEDIMVFGQAPCSAGRNKRRNMSYIGLLPPPQGALCDITTLYVARYGAPRPGEKLFIVTRQQQDGWEGSDQQTSEIVPAAPPKHQAIATVASTLKVYMHKGCTRDAQGISSQPIPGIQESSKPACPVDKAPADFEISNLQSEITATPIAQWVKPPQRLWAGLKRNV